MVRKSIVLLYIFLFSFSWLQAQENNAERQHIDIYYSDPKTFILGGIELRGIETGYDKEMLIAQSGLKIGTAIGVPGNEITRAVKRLYDLQVFSDVSILVDRVEDRTIYLIIDLKERHRLSGINYIGLKKSEETKIKEKLPMSMGMQVTENSKALLKLTIERYLKEKGYYNLDVRIVQRDDPAEQNRVLLDVLVEKKKKVKIDVIEITGNEEMKDGRLKAAMKKTKEKKLINFLKSSNYIEKNFEDDKQNLIAKFGEKGYRDAQIISDSVVQVSPGRVKIFLNVYEGNKYYFNDITWMGNTKYPSHFLSEILNIKKGEVYNETLLHERLSSDDDAVGNVYQNNGYLFSQIYPVETVVGKDSINLQIRVLEGPQATINKVLIKGNTTTHEHVIRRELYTYPGDYWSRENVMNSMRELGRMGHFEPEEIKPVPLPNQEEGTVDLEFHLKEKSNDRFELSGGWGAGMIIGTVKFSFNNFSIRNIFNPEAYHPLPQGDGQTFSLEAQTNGKFYTNFSIGFTEPWMGGKKPNSFSIGLNFSRQTGFSSAYSNSYYTSGQNSGSGSQSMMTFGFHVSLGRRLNWPDNLFTMQNSLSYQHYNLNNWNYYVISNGSSNTLTLGTVIRRSSIFNPIFPKSGSDFSLSVAFTPPYSWFTDEGRMENEKDDAKYRWIEFHKWKFQGKIYIPLTNQSMVEFSDEVKRPFVLYTGVQFGYLGHYSRYRRSPFEGFEMGGDGMSGYSLSGREYVGLRGYENGSLTNAGSSFIAPQTSDANLYAKITMELRYPIMLGTNSIYALGFLEAGNSWYKLKDFEPFNLYRSAGVGLRVFLPMFGMLGIDWGYGFDKVPGRENASGGQFHFVLGQEF